MRGFVTASREVTLPRPADTESLTMALTMRPLGEMVARRPIRRWLRPRPLREAAAPAAETTDPAIGRGHHHRQRRQRRDDAVRAAARVRQQPAEAASLYNVGVTAVDRQLGAGTRGRTRSADRPRRRRRTATCSSASSSGVRCGFPGSSSTARRCSSATSTANRTTRRRSSAVMPTRPSARAISRSRRRADPRPADGPAVRRQRDSVGPHQPAGGGAARRTIRCPTLARRERRELPAAGRVATVQRRLQFGMNKRWRNRHVDGRHRRVAAIDDRRRPTLRLRRHEPAVVRDRER